jgi:predicted AlkP superfamily phosphohydrolase/phosphomutase
MNRCKLLLVGVDGLDYDVVLRMGAEQLPKLHPLVAASQPHSSTFPPDSVPSWTTMLTGIPPWKHGRLHSKNYIIDSSSGPEVASLSGLEDQCFWHALRPDYKLAVINPFLAFPAFQPSPGGAMVSAPSFSELPASVADENNMLVGAPPERMGGFTSVPRQRDIAEFAAETLKVADAQFQYTLAQIDSKHWDVVFHTNLTVDRIQHFAWRHFDRTDPTHPGPKHADLVPAAYRQVDSFLTDATNLCSSDAEVVVFSDHGHGPRASVGVNLQEVLRRQGLYVVNTTPLRRVVETAKTALLSYAPMCHLDDGVIWLAKRMPAKAALKSGKIAGLPTQGSVNVPDIAGSNPYGGISTGGQESVSVDVMELLKELKYDDRYVTKWVKPVAEVFEATESTDHYPDLLFEFHPEFAPLWNMYGPVFAPIITRRRLSGGHTMRSVFATSATGIDAPKDSRTVHAALRKVCARL